MEEVAVRWFIILTKPQCEASATASLISRRFDAFGPSVYRSRVRMRHGSIVKDEHGRKIVDKIESPMFPGYIFIKFAKGAECFEDVRKVVGIREFMRLPGVGDRAVRSGDDKATVPAALISAIQAEQDSQLSAYEDARRTGADRLKIAFVVGGCARIDGGPYDDWVGKMVKMSKTGRVKMLLSAFGGEVAIEVDAGQVRAA